jgi:hypothetical protein
VCQLICSKLKRSGSAAQLKSKAYLSLNMKTLIIHPSDLTTTFLKPIYAPIQNKTVISGGIDKSKLQKLINEHERVIMLGHGTSNGLMAVGQFPDVGSYIIDNSFTELLSTRKYNIFIWCNADQYVHRNGLNGLYSGMFISEISEAASYNFWDVEPNTIDESNYEFARIVSEHINEPLEKLYKNVIHQYGILSKTNSIARFNVDRLYYERNCIGIKRGGVIPRSIIDRQTKKYLKDQEFSNGIISKDWLNK